jgi:hypothetical protein
MLAQFPQSTKARFKALQFRATPVIVSPERQAQAAKLAPSVRGLRPGVYLVGEKHFIDLWLNICTCREHRLQKNRPCRHRLALWLAEGVDPHDPDPVLYLKAASVEQPTIIAWYATIRRSVVGGVRECVARQLPSGAWQCLDTGDIFSRCADELWFLTPFYE